MGVEDGRGPGNLSYQTRRLLIEMLHLQQILNFIPDASTEDLRKILTCVQDELPKREGSVDSYVKHIEDFCEDTGLLDMVWQECESLNLKTNRRKVGSKWLSSTDTPYIYPDFNPVHKASDITAFPNIAKLLSIVNESTDVSGPLDSCLILKYDSKSSSLSVHDDNESCIDQNKSICSFSMGCDRTLEFFDKATVSRPKVAKSIRMKQNSLVIMGPGTQQNFKHGVRAEPNSSESEDQVRYSLSFRAVKREFPTVPPDPKTETAPQNSSQSPVKYVNIVAGDSHAARLDEEKLGKGKQEVENIAVGGAKMDKVQEQLDHYAKANPNSVVKKIIISVGTNDIRNCRDLNSLRGPFKNLCKKIDDIYPNSKVFFQSLLPLPVKNDQDWLTNRRVQDFNRIIFNECVFRRYHYIDVFYPLTKFRRQRYEPVKRFDKLFESKGIHLNKERGLGVLARFYIRALHSKFFNPCVFQ